MTFIYIMNMIYHLIKILKVHFLFVYNKTLGTKSSEPSQDIQTKPWMSSSLSSLRVKSKLTRLEGSWRHHCLWRAAADLITMI